MKYGLPYQGSKNAIAKKIISLLPNATHFYDLFAGGCAVTHAVLLQGGYKHYHANDISDVPKLFLDAVSGKFAHEQRWISREDFARLKDTDIYVRVCWSFGNNQCTYLYSKEIEPWKKALHYARVYGDCSLLREFGIDTDGSSADIVAHHEEYKSNYVEWYKREVLKYTKEEEALRKETERTEEELRSYLCDALKASGLTQSEINRRTGVQMCAHWFGRSDWSFPTYEFYTMLQQWLPLPLGYFDLVNPYKQSLQSLQSLESLQRLQRLQSMQSMQSLQSLQSMDVTRKDYRDVEILPDSIIYCDIPYKDTNNDYNNANFDHAAFYEWALSQNVPVFISEYSMPDDFVCISEINHINTYSAKSNKKCIERVFVPKKQLEESNFLKLCV